MVIYGLLFLSHACDFILSNFPPDNQQWNDGWTVRTSTCEIVEHPRRRRFCPLACLILFLEFVSLSQGGRRQVGDLCVVSCALYVDKL